MRISLCLTVFIHQHIHQNTVLTVCCAALVEYSTVHVHVHVYWSLSLQLQPMALAGNVILQH